ncbi:uncharacterized protein LOC112455662 [Temnothorax curvispinosus]|uniref:Uncharacterized protein LOC112455662 n=1 Tax=Temnothorax curvispinosus TaxID=300111 RepID=A0A6J1PUE0_9HYME|nr:uncharacterized protein LOC112455662 [Temnothorax curvispinosus]XP_024873489.1 uncharacterized protein LOC112455662 [Temnothorax curvispinosus]
MVRNNTKRNYKPLKASELQSALRSITHGPKLTIRQASQQFGIPFSTLREHLNFDELREISGRKTRKLGKPTFTAQEEAELVGHILRLAGMNNGITRQDLRRVVFEFAEAKRIKHYFNKRSKMTGRNWVYLFLKRNPQIPLRQLRGISLNRIADFNKNFFSNLQAIMKKHKFTPYRIYNMDETKIPTVQKKCSSVYAAEGKKRVGAVTSDKMGKTVTAAFCMNAAGCYIPPLIIFPGVRMDSRLQHNGPIGALYGCSKNGWTNEVLFCQWLEHFVKHVKPTADDPVLLILDYHSSHVSMAAYTFCIDNSITVVTVPPRMSHRMQPLDLTFFGPLKNVMHREFKLYLTSHPYEKIGEHNLAEFLNKAFIKVASMEKGISGFRSAGIWPLDRPDMFEENDFAPPDEDNEDVDQNSIIATEWCVYEESVNENVNLSDKSVTSDDTASSTSAILEMIPRVLPTPTKKKTVPG